jgi:hypothetical protein
VDKLQAKAYEKVEQAKDFFLSALDDFAEDR